MPSLPPADCAAPNLPGGHALFSLSGQAALREATEARLENISGVWKPRLLARDLIGALVPAIEYVLQAAGIPVLRRRIRAVRITRGVREHGSCAIPRGNDEECKLAFSGRLFFPGNAAALLSVVAHELLHAFLPARESHGALFRQGMRLINDALRLQIEIHAEKSAVRPSESLYRYKVVCSACGNTFYYLRAGAVVKRPARYRCAKCGRGALNVYRRTATNSGWEPQSQK